MSLFHSVIGAWLSFIAMIAIIAICARKFGGLDPWYHRTVRCAGVGPSAHCWQFVLCTCFNGTYVVTQNSSAVGPGVPQDTMRYTTSALVVLCSHLVPNLLLYLL
jgi:hypothetical protein